MIKVDFVRKVTFVKNIKECGRERISEARASLGENSQCIGTEVRASPEHPGSSWYGRRLLRDKVREVIQGLRLLQ